MFSAVFPEGALAERCSALPGQQLLRRAVIAPVVVYLESGRVALGLLDGDALTHRMGTVDGPFWLEASSALLELPALVDVVAETPAVFRKISRTAFRHWYNTVPVEVRKLLLDLARAHRQQSELAVSRLVKDAEARCAEWLLRHAQTSAHGALAVMLQQHKRLIAAQLGIAPETLSRVLRHLRERSLISGSGRVVHLVDPGGLRSLAGV